jgi:hypothetical protein
MLGCTTCCVRVRVCQLMGMPLQRWCTGDSPDATRTRQYAACVPALGSRGMISARDDPCGHISAFGCAVGLFASERPPVELAVSCVVYGVGLTIRMRSIGVSDCCRSAELQCRRLSRGCYILVRFKWITELLALFLPGDFPEYAFGCIRSRFDVQHEGLKDSSVHSTGFVRRLGVARLRLSRWNSKRQQIKDDP